MQFHLSLHPVPLTKLQSCNPHKIHLNAILNNEFFDNFKLKRFAINQCHIKNTKQYNSEHKNLQCLQLQPHLEYKQDRLANALKLYLFLGHINCIKTLLAWKGFGQSSQWHQLDESGTYLLIQSIKYFPTSFSTKAKTLQA